MYRIIITEEIKEYAKEYASKLFADKNINKRGRKFIKPKESSRKDGLHDLRNKMTCDDASFIQKAQKYIDKIWESYEELLVSKEYGEDGEKNFFYWKNEFEQILSQEELKTDVYYKKNKKFYEHLVDVMRYDSVGIYINPYFEFMEINSCVYCNFQKIELRDDDSPNYQLDHYWCKSRYPYLCISFFNLFPCCGACNIIKEDEDFPGYFNLYCEKKDIEEKNQKQDPFVFDAPDAVLKYYYYGDCDKAKITFNARDTYAPLYLEKSKIAKLYNGKHKGARKRLAEILYNLIDRTETQIIVDGNTYKLPYLKTDRYRAVFGEYYKKKDCHKKDLTKMSVDFGIKNGILLDL